ncbi:dihydrofolate reductase family protein [Aquihabitans sp. McL0605]|uniref:dihydrofolate reductase family protein n=1 Tax=Aquihabitans sp. McL0605 TaxID=3415671 RepID=UPI003CF1AE9C
MRQLLPEPADVDPFHQHAVAQRPAPPGRPWMALNMVSSADGATALGGVSGQLGGAADLAVFRALRGVADVIVAAAGTVRAEGYGPPRPTAEVQEARLARGQARVPRIVVVSRTLDLDETTSLFTDAVEPPLIFTVEGAPVHRLAALEPVADVRVAGVGSVDFATMATVLGDLGARCAIVEGGPVLNGQLLEVDLIDELNLTLSPMLVGGRSRRAVVSDEETAQRFRLAHLWESDGELLARYVRP